jgi:hypothetical protein
MKGHMQNKVDPGYGYRLLKDGEAICSGDQFLTYKNEWLDRVSEVGRAMKPCLNPTRRKIEPPAGYEIVPEGEDVRGEGFKYYSEENQCWRDDECAPASTGEASAGFLHRCYGYPAFARKIKEQVKVEPGYGYRLVGGAGLSFKNLQFRRRIDVGEGYRLVEENEATQMHDQCNARSNGDADGWITHCGAVGQVAGSKANNYWHFRRKVETGRFIVAQERNGRYQPATDPFVHINADQAEIEAARLARVHGGKFVVFKAVKAFEQTQQITISVNEVAV